jgi:HD-GYP domain-containing protein (c-di-GMP phosphodiesterase class II)
MNYEMPLHTAIPVIPEGQRELVTDRNESRARELVECGDYAQALSRLKEENLLDGERERLKRTYGEALKTANFLTDTLLEMAVVLELHDRETWEHSLRVYEIVRSIIQNNRSIGHYLREQLAAEDVSEEDLLVAALFHDVGKIHVPREIIHNAISNEEWARLAWDRLTPFEFSDIQKKLEKSPRLREKDVVPMAYGLTQEHIDKVKAFGIDPTLPLGVVFSDHPDRSAEIVTKYGFPKAAEIARNHHDRPLKEESDPTAISAFRASWILRYGDVFDAVKNSRSYKSEESLLETLEVLDIEGERGFIDPEYVGILMRDHFFTEKRSLSPKNPKEYARYQTLRNKYLVVR